MRRTPGPSAGSPPRRQALTRAGGALALALVLGLLGLVVGERGGAVREVVTSELDRAQVPASVSLVTPGTALEAQQRVTEGAASTDTRLFAPASTAAGSVSAPPSVQAPPASPPMADAGAVPSPAVAPAPAPALGDKPEARVDGVLIPAAALAAGGAGYRVQLGVFADAGNALKLYEQLAAEGYPASIQSRVVIGPFADRAAAEKARQDLRRAGVGQGVLVAPERSR